MAFTMVDFAGLNGHGAFHNGREAITNSRRLRSTISRPCCDRCPSQLRSLSPANCTSDEKALLACPKSTEHVNISVGRNDSRKQSTAGQVLSMNFM